MNANAISLAFWKGPYNDDDNYNYNDCDSNHEKNIDKNIHNHNAKDNDNENVKRGICNFCNNMFGLFIIQQSKYFERKWNKNNQS